ncbi:MAG: restriction endonuclease subunit S, partial [Dolichospermum sp.]
LNSNDIKNFEIRLPKDIITQKKIAAVLSSLDDKIEINNRINSELENLAKTIYDYWFVQFDFPDENGTPYKSSGGKMVYNQELKREIPAGWEVKLLGDIGKNIKNVIKQTDIDPEISYIGLEHIPRKKIALDTWSTAFDLASDKLSFTRRDILFGKLRPYFHKVGVAFISGVCSTDILVLNSKKESYFGLFLMVVSSDNFINYVNLATEGTRMPRTKWEFMKQYLLAVPKEDINQKFNDILKPLISQMENNTYQNQQLTQLRDWLLPMLMNGQITVK